MANQTVTTTVNYDDSSISGLDNGDSITINGGSVTINSDVRWNQQEAVFGSVTISPSLGGSFIIDGSDVWELPFDASTGNVPTQDVFGGANGITGASGGTGELLRVWATGSLTPEAAGVTMPATGWVKLRSKTGNFSDNEVVDLPGGATITLTGPGKRSWIHVVAREATVLTIPRLATFSVDGDWYELGETNGATGQQFQFPVADECLAVQVETAPGSGTYEWWLNGGARFVGIANTATGAPTTSNSTVAAAATAAPVYTSDPYGYSYHGYRVRENTTNAAHFVQAVTSVNNCITGNYKFRTFIKKETRQWGWVQAVTNSGSTRYTVLIDFDNSGTVVDTQSVGLPTGTSHTVTDVGNGWYLVELTLDHDNLASTTAIISGTSNSATPSYNANGQPSFAGLTTEGMFVSELQIIAPLQMIADNDARGKYFFSNPTTGILTFAQRTGITAGNLPASGCKVRIPNVILSNAALIDYSVNTQNFTAATRYYTSVTGIIDIRKACCNWYLLATNAFAVDIRDSAVWVLSASNLASTANIQNCGFGISRDIDTVPIAFTNCFSGGTITDVRVARRLGSTSNSTPFSFSTCAAFTLTRVRNDLFGFSGRTERGTATARAYVFTNCSDFTLDECVGVGGGMVMTTSVRMNVLDFEYAHLPFGDTTASGAALGAIEVTTSSSNIYIDGFSAFDSLTDQHPANRILYATTNIDTLELRNVGTPSAPYLGGNAVANGNRMANGVSLIATCLNVTLRRIYTENLRDSTSGTLGMVVAGAVTNQNVKVINVWGDPDERTTVICVNQLCQGCRWSNDGIVTNAVFGTHWEDSFTGLTSGRLTISGNEPLPNTADQCSFTFGANAGFNSAGAASMPNVGDEIVWTMPYYAIGHTGIAQFTYGTSTTENWFMTGVNQQNFEYEYQIDKNDGNDFSAWKPLLNIGRRASGGVSGTNTVTITAADWDAMTNPPQVGDYITTTSTAAPTAKVPAGTTITNISGYDLTLSDNFTSNMASNELCLFWKDIADEVIDPEDGYKLKVKCRVNTANSTNEFRFLRIPFDTDSTIQQLQYPLPQNRQGVITNIRAGSRMQIFNQTTNTEILNTVVGGTSFIYDYAEGVDISEGDEIRIRLARCLGSSASIGYEGFALANEDGFALFAAQEDDAVYNANGIDGTTITEFTFDYPNVEIDINDPDGTTDIKRLYAWWSNERTTEQGIRDLIGGLLAEDVANYRIISSRIDLKLDNTASTGVIFTGGTRLYRDDGAAPVVASTTGGGSITLYADKVYIAETGTSGLTPSESAKLDQISNLALETTAQAALKAAKTAVALSA